MKCEKCGCEPDNPNGFCGDCGGEPITDYVADFRALRRQVALALIMRGEHTHLGHECLWDKATSIARAEPKE